MQKLSQFLCGAAALLMIAGVANAQPPRDRDDRDDRYRSYGRESLDRVRADLDRAGRDMNYLSEDERRRFSRVRDRISEFQRDWERGRFDREALNETIRGLESIIERSRLHARDRDTLARDVSQLREMRERYERRGGGDRR
jgi:hypothetical protein